MRIRLKKFCDFFYIFTCHYNDVIWAPVLPRIFGGFRTFGWGVTPPKGKEGKHGICKRSVIDSPTTWYRSHFIISNRFFYRNIFLMRHCRNCRKIGAKSAPRDTPLKRMGDEQQNDQQNANSTTNRTTNRTSSTRELPVQSRRAFAPKIGVLCVDTQ